MALGSSDSSLALATRSLSAMSLLLAALPAAAQKELWVRQFGTTVDDDAYAAAPDGSGGVYVGGATLGALGGPKVGSHDAWLARYDSAGNQLWARQVGSGAGDYARAA
ncbi:MAG TPA: hypothetical protein VMS76_11340, partial [Planctomycetota bacterium]|nr:hypothetical protein [Planctomycetota bacterium]